MSGLDQWLDYDESKDHALEYVQAVMRSDEAILRSTHPRLRDRIAGT
ncbi:MAG: hypothetical protein R3C11_17495 [Planctomycetaceae bacterium]